MSVLERKALEGSPLADLHAIASELTIDGFRRLRKADLIEAIITRQGGEEATDVAEAEETEAETADSVQSTDSIDETAEESAAASRRRRGRRGGRGRSGAKDSTEDSDSDADADVESEAEAETKPAPRRRSTPAAKKADRPERSEKSEKSESQETVEGIVELLPNGSGFVRVAGSEPSDDDVYVSAAQVKRCELVSGDRVTGPRRPPQRSERFASLVRVDTINGRAASEVSDGSRFEDLPASFPSDRFRFASEDDTIKAIEFLTPIGRGSRVTIVGGAWAGKSHTLKSLALAFGAIDEVTTLVALAGVRPEELSAWTETEGITAPAASLSFAASTDAQDHAVELVIDQARRVATRGGHAVVLVDTLDHLHPHTAAKVLASARNLQQGGSVTVIATSSNPRGGETTVISLDAKLAATGRFPALDLVFSGTLAAELLVGDAGARAIAEARAEAQAVSI